jgi:hypothetical protein
MEARATVTCAECGKRREVSGEIPSEYTDCFTQVVREDGFVPKPGTTVGFLCGACLRRYEGVGSESRDDAEKI